MAKWLAGIAAAIGAAYGVTWLALRAVVVIGVPMLLSQIAAGAVMPSIVTGWAILAALFYMASGNTRAGVVTAMIVAFAASVYFVRPGPTALEVRADYEARLAKVSEEGRAAVAAERAAVDREAATARAALAKASVEERAARVAEEANARLRGVIAEAEKRAKAAEHNAERSAQAAAPSQVDSEWCDVLQRARAAHLRQVAYGYQSSVDLAKRAEDQLRQRGCALG